MRTLIICLFVSILFSCRKRGVTTVQPSLANTITATIDNVSRSFNYGGSVGGSNSTPAYGYYILVLSGKENTSTAANTIQIAINNLLPITTKTYSEYPDDNVVINLISYNNVNDYGSPFNGINPDPVTVTITSISSSSIEGTFKGSVYLDEDINKMKKTISKGQFHINF